VIALKALFMTATVTLNTCMSSQFTLLSLFICSAFSLGPVGEVHQVVCTSTWCRSCA